MKKSQILKVFLLSFIPLASFSQSITGDSLFISSKGTQLKAGDNLIIGYPSQNNGEFVFVSNETKKKLGMFSKIAGVTSSVGSSVLGVGLGSGSIETIRTGAKVAEVAGTTSQIASVGDVVLKGENELIGQRVKILKFTQTGNEKRGIHFFAIVAGSGASNFRIEIEPAILTQELAGNNNEFFENFNVK